MIMMMLIAAVSVEAVLHRLQPEPTATLPPRPGVTVVRRVQKTHQEAQTTSTTEARFDSRRTSQRQRYSSGDAERDRGSRLDLRQSGPFASRCRRHRRS